LAATIPVHHEYGEPGVQHDRGQSMDSDGQRQQAPMGPSKKMMSRLAQAAAAPRNRKRSACVPPWPAP